MGKVSVLSWLRALIAWKNLMLMARMKGVKQDAFAS